MGLAPSKEETIAEGIMDGKVTVNACEVNLERVRVLQESGASNTVIVFADLLAQAGDPTTPIVAKIWMDPPQIDMQYCPDIAALDYEARVYAYVSKNLAPYSPFFIPFIAFAKCSVAQIQSWGEDVTSSLGDLPTFGVQAAGEKVKKIDLQAEYAELAVNENKGT